MHKQYSNAILTSSAQNGESRIRLFLTCHWPSFGKWRKYYNHRSITHTIDGFFLSSADFLLFFFSSLKLFTLYFCKDVYNFLWKGWETTTKLQIIKFVFRLKAKVIANHGRRVLHRNMKNIVKEICSCGWNRRMLM